MNEDIIIEKFADRFSGLVKNSSISIPKLAKMLGIKSKSTIYRYMNGEMTPKVSTVKYASEIFNVNSLWLMGYDIPKYSDTEKTDGSGNLVSPIPLISTVKAGADFWSDAFLEGTLDLDKRIADTGDFFALRIKDNSMVPIFFEDDIVIIKKQDFCENNEVAVVIVGGNDGSLFMVRKTDDGIVLHSFNQATTPVLYTNNEITEIPIIIVGVFQELRRLKIKF